jgi:hypothetical protein
MSDPAKEPACALLRRRGTPSGRLFLGCRRPPGNQKSAGIRKETAGTPGRTVEQGSTTLPGDHISGSPTYRQAAPLSGVQWPTSRQKTDYAYPLNTLRLNQTPAKLAPCNAFAQPMIY